MTENDLDVHAAYALETTEDRKQLYAAWANTYDSEFAAASDYIYPQHVADVFHKRNGQGPVLDAGAGTGLLAQALQAHRAHVIDAFDLSPEMLAVAREKGLYRALFVGDLTKELPFKDATYSAVVSSGTFTHGHVGPDAFDALMRVAAPGALFALSIKTELYRTQGFEAKFNALSDQIKGFELTEVRVYGADADAGYAPDTGLIASFYKV
ncbi:MAG: class I SAM-dependent methyltransferase [Roseobacter sp.]